jgi:hypothetical protein
MLLKIFSSLLVLELLGCSHGKLSEPIVFRGDHVNQEIMRDPVTKIKCNDPQFDQYYCINKQDFEDMVTELLYLRAKDAGNE